MSEPEPNADTELLYGAVKYMLDRIQDMPDVRYYCGFGCEMFQRLCQAEAAYLGKPLADIEKARRVDLQPPYRKMKPEVIRLRDQLHELRVETGR